MKKALSLLLAVLMLVSLFSGMAFADDDVIVEEPVAVDEIVGDDFAEAADAYVEEYTDEGSFEAADAISWEALEAEMKAKGWELEYMVPADPTCGQEVEVHMRDADSHVSVSTPRTAIYPHVWELEKVVSVKEATCTEDGLLVEQYKCVKCKETKTVETKLDRQQHSWVKDPLTAPEGESSDIRAIVVWPTAEKAGVGHEVCKFCGGFRPAPEGKDYEIPKHDAAAKHVYGDWTEKVAPTCSKEGFKERICIVPGCDASEDEKLLKLNHTVKTEKDMLVFDSLVRVDCTHYAEKWVCSNPDCCSKLNKDKTGWESSNGVASWYFEYRGPNGMLNTFKEAELENFKDQCFLYTKDYTDATAGIVDHNTEHFEHHRFTTDWEVTTAPKCCEDGVATRICADCFVAVTHPVPALEPIFSEKMVIDHEHFGDHYVHYQYCTRPECAEKSKVPVFGKDPEIKVTDPEYYTQVNNQNQQANVIDHSWGEWKVEVPVTATQRGHLYRTCTIPGCGERMDFFGNQAEFDAKYGHPVLKAGIYKDEDGAFKLYEMGVFDEDFTGIYNGYNDVLGQSGEWYVVEGIWENDAMGATLVGSTWYFLANGKVQKVTQLAEYQGKWFYVVNGVIDTSKTALVDYNGGKFVVALGRIVDEYSGLWQNAKSIGGDDSWYYVAKGQVQTQYTGLVQYNGEWFYVENGQLVPYNGEVEYDGEIFNVKEGMVVAA